MVRKKKKRWGTKQKPYIWVDKYKRTRFGKVEFIPYHTRYVKPRPRLSKVEKEKIKRGKMKRLLKDKYDKSWIGFIESDMKYAGKEPIIPLWVYKYGDKYEVLEFYKRRNRFPTAKERILLLVHKKGYYWDLKDLAKDSVIPYKNLGRYLKELEKEGKIEVKKYGINQKKVEKPQDWRKAHDQWKELVGLNLD